MAAAPGSQDFVNRKTAIRFSLFLKMNALIILLFVPIVILFAYSNGVTNNVISKELKESNMTQLVFLSSQLENRISQTVNFVISFSRDPNVEKFNGLNIWDDRYDRMQTRYVVQEKMSLQSGLNNIWPVDYSVYSQQNKEAISNAKAPVAYDEDYLKANMSGKWTYGDGRSSGSAENGTFNWFYAASYGYQGTLKGSDLVVQASFSHDNIRKMLDEYKAGGQGNALLYRKGETPIVNESAAPSLLADLANDLDSRELGDKAQYIASLDGQSYLISSIRSTQLDWYLVDAVPLDQMLGPIAASRNLFYLTMALLLAVGISASVLLYRNVQRPIIQLIRGLQSVQRGDFSVQIKAKVNNEFSFLFYRFNEMSREIQELVEKVLGEKLRAREATLKQLQAQINPHFLYNCLGFIINMAQMKEEEAVVSMAYNLSAYYRYTTRMERETAALEEEMKLVVNYLEIQMLRNSRIRYRIDLPEEMKRQQVPRLILQPLVENAIIHGISKSYAAGEIVITGSMGDGFCRIYVDDDGPGLDKEGQEQLLRKMQEPLQEEMGCGLWNTNRRLMHLFGEGSCLRFCDSPLGGFRTELIWRLPEEKEKLAMALPEVKGVPALA